MTERKKDDSDSDDYTFSGRSARGKSIALGAPQEKYNRILQIRPDDVHSPDDLKDGIILFFRLSENVKLAEEVQIRKMKEFYEKWDVPKHLSIFQQEELFEMAQQMNELDDESFAMYSTLEKYTDERESYYRLKPLKLEDSKKFRDLQSSNNKNKYQCAGCGLPIEYESESAEWRFWKAFYTQTHRTRPKIEFLFHNRLCLKLRKAKQVIRDMVKRNGNQTNEQAMIIDFVNRLNLSDDFRPTKIFTTFDESNLYVKYKDNIRYYRNQVRRTDYLSFDIDEGDRWGDVPEGIKYLDLREFALPLLKFIVWQCATKEFDGFWTLLSFFTSHIDTPTMLSLMDEHQNILFPLHSSKRQVLLPWLTTICEGSVYPIATCLSIASYVDDNGEDYFDEEEVERLKDHFVNMAHSLMAEVESDHLIAIILEMPTNIDGKSALDIAIENKMLNFLQSPKISAWATTLWYERKIIHPKKSFGQEISWIKLYRRLVFRPSKFYFSPAGMNVVVLTLFVTYLTQFCYVTYKTKYNFEDDYEPSELILWWFNVGQFLYVGYQLFTQNVRFVSSWQNIIEMIISIVWSIIFVMKFIFPADVVRDSNGNKDELATRNSTYVEVYMGLWAFQCVLFWGKMIFFFKRLRSVGPMLTMIMLMVRDMINFLILSVIFLIGVMWGMYFIIGYDLVNTEGGLGPLSSVTEFAFQSFLGQQEWEWLESGEGTISTTRSRLLDTCVIFIQLVGYILLLNLLIAMLASRFQEVEEKSKLEVNYTRVVDSFNASRGNALIAPPLNYFAFGLMALWFLFDTIITVITARTRILNDWYFTPLNKNAFSPGDEIQYKVYDDTGKKIGTKTGFVHRVHTNEIAIVQIGGKEIQIPKRDIAKTIKSITTERPRETGASTCARVSRYYCKFCRFQFTGDTVGCIDAITRLFKTYGILMDNDDVGKVRSMLGEKIAKSPVEKLYYNAQLCPECSRPFMAHPNHSDEVQRVQFLGEISSFWVFCALIWAPLIIVLAFPAFISFLSGKSSLSKKKKQQLQIEKEQQKIMWVENVDSHRDKVRNVFDNETTFERRVEQMRSRMQRILKRIRESKHENDNDNIATQLKDEVRERTINLSQKEAWRRSKLLQKTHDKMMKRCDVLNQHLKNYIRAQKGLPTSPVHSSTKKR